MIKRVSKVLLAFALIAAILLPLQGCWWIDQESENVADDYMEVPGDEPMAEPARRPLTMGRFTLRYSPGRTLNPITASNRDNIIVSTLMYESLFVLDENFMAEPVLAASYYTADFITYIINVRPGIVMHDGTQLTADDVAYSLRQARLNGRFINRFGIIDSITSDGELTVTIVLNVQNSRFTNLLDVPIIKSGTSDRRVPPGSGPYVYLAGSMLLYRFEEHRDSEYMPFELVHLLECDYTALNTLFSDGALSLIWDDPAGLVEISLNRAHETRFYDTTTLQFLGFNTRNAALSVPNVRRAIGFAIDREHIIDTILPEHAAVAAHTALSPVYRLYNSDWENFLSEREVDGLLTVLYNLARDPIALVFDESGERFDEVFAPQATMDELREALREPLVLATALLAQAGLADHNYNSFLDFPNGYGGFVEFSIDFIVSQENMFRVETARAITETLRQIGFNITLRELPWEAFLNALATGDFDMYYGEVTLGADFDLSPLLLPGGRFDFGGTGREEYGLYMTAFLRTATDWEEAAAARALVNRISRSAPFVPILYTRHAIYTPRGAVVARERTESPEDNGNAPGISPSQSTIFRNITSWVVDFTRLS
ncbi:MAG: ABC transporter substrate-binding protein [Oscillospiraceae bacterium]|nr:ABC transporter substrate-binding protein [Oscillospiraceae bacterium]